MDKLFATDSSYCYSSRPCDPKKGGVNIQAYLGKMAYHSEIKPTEYRKEVSDPMIIQMPIDQFVIDKEEHESYQQLKVLTIDKRLKNYTCFCKAFMIFVNEKEVKI